MGLFSNRIAINRLCGETGTVWVCAVLFLLLILFTSSLYFLVVFNKLNVITGLLFLAALSSFTFFVTEVLVYVCSLSREARNKLRLSLSTTCIMVFMAELFCRFIIGTYANYHEKNGSKNYTSPYSSAFSYANRSWLFVHKRNTTVVLRSKEFVHQRTTNSLGLSEQEVQQTKRPDEYRIIVLGDSFTEGVGASYDSTWVKVAEKSLSMHVYDRKITTINAGIFGSDICFAYILFKEQLSSFQPDLLIVAINHTDIEDIIARGGMERFQADRTVRRQQRGPSWEWIYGISYLFRHIIHDVFKYNWMLLAPDAVGPEEQTAVQKMKLTLEQFSLFARERNLPLLFVFHPLEEEIVHGAYFPSAFNDLVRDLKTSLFSSTLDLLEYYQVSKRITKENSAEFFWPVDRHHNTKGYAIMGAAVAEKVLALHFLDRQDMMRVDLPSKR